MSYLIGQASKDENGSYAGGRAGDQSGEEVYIRQYYDYNWDVLIRPKHHSIGEKMAKFCEDVCNNSLVGYDQWQRNTLRIYAKEADWDGSKIDTACECDCASFMAVCTEAAGLDVDCLYSAGNAPCTSWMADVYSQIDEFDVYYPSNVARIPSQLRRGDIIVRSDAHTCMVLTTGEDAEEWDYDDYPPEPTTEYIYGDLIEGLGGLHLEYYGCRNPEVKAIQRTLFARYHADEDYSVTGIFDEQTKADVIQLQTENGLDPDGIVGANTWKLINEELW